MKGKTGICWECAHFDGERRGERFRFVCRLTDADAGAEQTACDRFTQEGGDHGAK